MRLPKNSSHKTSILESNIIIFATNWKLFSKFTNLCLKKNYKKPLQDYKRVANFDTIKYTFCDQVLLLLKWIRFNPICYYF